MGKLITLLSFMYVLYITMRDRGYLDELKDKLNEQKEKWKEKYEKSGMNDEWYTVDAEDILRQRFASGEIDEEEYKMRMNVLKR